MNMVTEDLQILTHTGTNKTGNNFDQVQGWKIHKFINILVFWPDLRKLMKTDKLKHYDYNIDTDKQTKTKYHW